MQIAIVGTGYVGLVTGASLAELGHHVVCYDVDQRKIEQLQNHEIPIYEPGLRELVERNSHAERLSFTLNPKETLKAKAIFLALNTPSTETGEADLSSVFDALEVLAKDLNPEQIIIMKSTVPVNTSKRVGTFLREKTGKEFSVANNPEFLREGTAVEDFMNPDRVVVGVSDQRSRDLLNEIYAPLTQGGRPIYFMSNASAELTKYAANSFLATKISFINEMARLCDQVGADIDEVREGLVSDHRIAPQFFRAGVGYGGSCFPKDVKALMKSAEGVGCSLNLIPAVEATNEAQRRYFVDKIKNYFKGDRSPKTFAMWGVAFKPNTDDVRESSSQVICQALMDQGHKIRFYDPVASENFLHLMGTQNENLTHCTDMYQAIEGCEGLILMTEWGEFRAPHFEKIADLLKVKVIFDGRNIYDGEKLKDYGITCLGMGKGADFS